MKIFCKAFHLRSSDQKIFDNPAYCLWDVSTVEKYSEKGILFFRNEKNNDKIVMLFNTKESIYDEGCDKKINAIVDSFQEEYDKHDDSSIFAIYGKPVIFLHEEAETSVFSLKQNGVLKVIIERYIASEIARPKYQTSILYGNSSELALQLWTCSDRITLSRPYPCLKCKWFFQAMRKVLDDLCNSGSFDQLEHPCLVSEELQKITGNSCQIDNMAGCIYCCQPVTHDEYTMTPVTMKEENGNVVHALVILNKLPVKVTIRKTF